MDKFIVAEITKTWDVTFDGKQLLNKQFEDVINVNHKRGYNLKEWKFTTIRINGVIQETIIAIFELDSSYIPFEEIPK